ncbi:hypothetical protein H312_03567, partial [Anncaliia algerae PRA339]
MNRIVKVSSEEFKTLFYELGMDNRLPNSWDLFKEFLVEFCAEESIYSFKKYKEEKWSWYLTRLKDWAEKRNFSEYEIFKKIRSDYLPKQLQIIFYSKNFTLEEAIQMVKEWEISFKRNENNVEGIKFMEKKGKNNMKKIIKCFECGKEGHTKINCLRNIKENVKCFKCGNVGHYSNNCNAKKANRVKINLSKRLDERIIKIDNRPYKAVFDTGATDNMICSGLLKKIDKTKIDHSKIREFYLINGTRNKTMGVIDI